jgi:RNA polymerase sigma-70 factor, ECF subfamily
MSFDDSDTETRLQDLTGGDEQALEWLLDRHRSRLRRMIALRIDDRLSSRLDPSDVVQETLTDAARKLPDYARDRPLPFYPWLHRIALERLAQTHRHHLRTLRREAGRERTEELVTDGSTARLADAIAASGTSPSGHVIREEERLLVASALERLPEADREILVMRYLDQLSFSEIASILDITEGAVRVRHFRALERIGPLLGMLAEDSAP